MSRSLYNNPKVEKLVTTIENQNFEKKTAFIQPESLAAEFSAFANSSIEGGLVVLGIKEDKIPVGIDIVEQSKINKLIQAQRVYCSLAQVSHKEITIKNSKGIKDRLLLFYVEFSPNKVIKLISGKAYERVGDQTCEMSLEKIRQMEYDKKETDFEKELISNLTIKQLSSDLIKNFIKKWIKRDGLTKEPTTEELILTKGFGQREKGDIRINYAGALLFHEHPHNFIAGAKIRFFRYEGIKVETGTRSNMIKDRFFEGPINQQIDQLAEMIKTQIREFSFLGEDGKFKTVLEYPEFAWYEATVNAIAHRAYNLKPQNIFVRMFDDRIEIQSPGSLPGIVTIENIYEESFPRNPTVMQGLLYLDYVKFASEGIDRIRDEMIALNLPTPEFQNDKQAFQFRVILKNNVKTRAIKSDLEDLGKINQRIFEGLKENETKIIYYLARNQKGQISDFQKELNLSRTSTIDYVRLLERKRLLQRIGELGPNVHYILTDLVFIKTKSEQKAEDLGQKKLI